MISVPSLNFTKIGFESPIFLILIPVAIIFLFYLFFIRESEIQSNKKRKTALFTSRVIIAVLLISAAAQPYSIQTKTTTGDPSVRILVDNSDSMQVHSSNIIQNIATDIESSGVPVRISKIGSDKKSQIGNQIISNIQKDGNILLFTDGYVTSGRSLDEAAEIANSVNARINAINISATGSEKYLSINGPSKTSQGVETEFKIRLGGVNTAKSASRVNVKIDGKQVASNLLKETGQFQINHTFQSVGEHRVTATVSGGDKFQNNNAFYKTIRVVKQPKILYVSKREMPFLQILNNLYNVDKADKIPSDLGQYYAVVLQDMPSNSLGDLKSLQEFVIDGNGLVAVGGPNSYENGGYSSSPISDMLPVKPGEANRISNVVLVVDISGSTEEQMSAQKALALDVINQMGDGNRVGVVAFNQAAYKVSGLQKLGRNRNEIKNNIRRLQSQGATVISSGLKGAEEMLGNSGNIILITDGIANDPQKALETAQRLGVKGLNIISVGVGARTNEKFMRILADRSEGKFFRADQTNRLRVLFGGQDKEPKKSGLTIVNFQHFITSGVNTESNPPNSNKVTVKDTGNLLVASSSGSSAVASTRYGIGRVVSITVYGKDGTLDGLLSKPDSLLLSRSTNWAIGDPNRKRSNIVEISDTRVGKSTKVTYIGDSRPSIGELEFSRSGEREYTSTIVPTSTGYKNLGNSEYAVNYPIEYSAFGFSDSLRRVVSSTGGKIYSPNEAQKIASEVKSRTTSPREVKEEFTWIVLILALILYLIEILVRRIQEVYGYTLYQNLPKWIPYIQ